MSDIESSVEKVGFGCFSAGFGLAIGLGALAWIADSVNGCATKRAVAREEAERERTEETLKVQGAESKRLREDTIRSFALAEAPELWRVYLRVQAELEEQSRREEKLRLVLGEFGRDPDSDMDYSSLVSMREDLRQALDKMKTKIEDAYLASCKFEATPSCVEFGNQMRNDISEGLKVAELLQQRYGAMRERMQCREQQESEAQ